MSRFTLLSGNGRPGQASSSRFPQQRNTALEMMNSADFPTTGLSERMKAFIDEGAEKMFERMQAVHDRHKTFFENTSREQDLLSAEGEEIYRRRRSSIPRAARGAEGGIRRRMGTPMPSESVKAEPEVVTKSEETIGNDGKYREVRTERKVMSNDPRRGVIAKTSTMRDEKHDRTITHSTTSSGTRPTAHHSVSRVLNLKQPPILAQPKQESNTHLERSKEEKQHSSNTRSRRPIRLHLTAQQSSDDNDVDHVRKHSNESKVISKVLSPRLSRRTPKVTKSLSVSSQDSGSAVDEEEHQGNISTRHISKFYKEFSVDSFDEEPATGDVKMNQSFNTATRTRHVQPTQQKDSADSNSASDDIPHPSTPLSPTGTYSCIPAHELPDSALNPHQQRVPEKNAASEIPSSPDDQLKKRRYSLKQTPTIPDDQKIPSQTNELVRTQRRVFGKAKEKTIDLASEPATSRNRGKIETSKIPLKASEGTKTKPGTVNPGKNIIVSPVRKEKDLSQHHKEDHSSGSVQESIHCSSKKHGPSDEHGKTEAFVSVPPYNKSIPARNEKLPNSNHQSDKPKKKDKDGSIACVGGAEGVGVGDEKSSQKDQTMYASTAELSTRNARSVGLEAAMSKQQSKSGFPPHPNNDMDTEKTPEAFQTIPPSKNNSATEVTAACKLSDGKPELSSRITHETDIASSRTLSNNVMQTDLKSSENPQQVTKESSMPDLRQNPAKQQQSENISTKNATFQNSTSEKKVNKQDMFSSEQLSDITLVQADINPDSLYSNVTQSDMCDIIPTADEGGDQKQIPNTCTTVSVFTSVADNSLLEGSALKSSTKYDMSHESDELLNDDNDVSIENSKTNCSNNSSHLEDVKSRENYNEREIGELFIEEEKLIQQEPNTNICDQCVEDILETETSDTPRDQPLSPGNKVDVDGEKAKSVLCNEKEFTEKNKPLSSNQNNDQTIQKKENPISQQVDQTVFEQVEPPLEQSSVAIACESSINVEASNSEKVADAADIGQLSKMPDQSGVRRSSYTANEILEPTQDPPIDDRSSNRNSLSIPRRRGLTEGDAKADLESSNFLRVKDDARVVVSDSKGHSKRKKSSKQKSLKNDSMVNEKENSTKKRKKSKADKESKSKKSGKSHKENSSLCSDHEGVGEIPSDAQDGESKPLPENDHSLTAVQKKPRSTKKHQVGEDMSSQYNMKESATLQGTADPTAASKSNDTGKSSASKNEQKHHVPSTTKSKSSDDPRSSSKEKQYVHEKDLNIDDLISRLMPTVSTRKEVAAPKAVNSCDSYEEKAIKIEESSTSREVEMLEMDKKAEESNALENALKNTAIDFVQTSSKGHNADRSPSRVADISASNANEKHLSHSDLRNSKLSNENDVHDNLSNNDPSPDDLSNKDPSPNDLSNENETSEKQMNVSLGDNTKGSLASRSSGKDPSIELEATMSQEAQLSEASGEVCSPTSVEPLLSSAKSSIQLGRVSAQSSVEHTVQTNSVCENNADLSMQDNGSQCGEADQTSDTPQESTAIGLQNSVTPAGSKTEIKGTPIEQNVLRTATSIDSTNSSIKENQPTPTTAVLNTADRRRSSLGLGLLSPQDSIDETSDVSQSPIKSRAAQIRARLSSTTEYSSEDDRRRRRSVPVIHVQKPMEVETMAQRREKRRNSNIPQEPPKEDFFDAFETKPKSSTIEQDVKIHVEDESVARKDASGRCADDGVTSKVENVSPKKSTTTEKQEMVSHDVQNDKDVKPTYPVDQESKQDENRSRISSTKDLNKLKGGARNKKNDKVDSTKEEDNVQNSDGSSLYKTTDSKVLPKQNSSGFPVKVTTQNEDSKESKVRRKSKSPSEGHKSEAQAQEKKTTKQKSLSRQRSLSSLVAENLSSSEEEDDSNEKRLARKKGKGSRKSSSGSRKGTRRSSPDPKRTEQEPKNGASASHKPKSTKTGGDRLKSERSVSDKTEIGKTNLANKLDYGLEESEQKAFVENEKSRKGKNKATSNIASDTKQNTSEKRQADEKPVRCENSAADYKVTPDKNSQKIHSKNRMQIGALDENTDSLQAERQPPLHDEQNSLSNKKESQNRSSCNVIGKRELQSVASSDAEKKGLSTPTNLDPLETSTSRTSVLPLNSKITDDRKQNENLENVNSSEVPSKQLVSASDLLSLLAIPIDDGDDTDKVACEPEEQTREDAEKVNNVVNQTMTASQRKRHGSALNNEKKTIENAVKIDQTTSPVQTTVVQLDNDRACKQIAVKSDSASPNTEMTTSSTAAPALDASWKRRRQQPQRQRSFSESSVPQKEPERCPEVSQDDSASTRKGRIAIPTLKSVNRSPSTTPSAKGTPTAEFLNVEWPKLRRAPVSQKMPDVALYSEDENEFSELLKKARDRAESQYPETDVDDIFLDDEVENIEEIYDLACSLLDDFDIPSTRERLASQSPLPTSKEAQMARPNLPSSYLGANGNKIKESLNHSSAKENATESKPIDVSDTAAPTSSIKSTLKAVPKLVLQLSEDEDDGPSFRRRRRKVSDDITDDDDYFERLQKKKNHVPQILLADDENEDEEEDVVEESEEKSNQPVFSFANRRARTPMPDSDDEFDFSSFPAPTTSESAAEDTVTAEEDTPIPSIKVFDSSTDYYQKQTIARRNSMSPEASVDSGISTLSEPYSEICRDVALADGDDDKAARSCEDQVLVNAIGRLRSVPRTYEMTKVEQIAGSEDSARNLIRIPDNRECTRPLAELLERDSNRRYERRKSDSASHAFGITPEMLQGAMLKMNGVLTNDQISAVEAGEKPKGASIKRQSAVKASEPPSRPITQLDEETDLDVVALMKCLKTDSDDLFYLCINNQPKLEKHVLHEIFKRIGLSDKIRHVSLALTGISDDDVKLLAKHLRYNETIETMNLESNLITVKGIDVLMKVIGRHPAMREVKVSNQKHALGGQGEEYMAKAIENNDKILKFGYSFTNPGARNKADRAILKHNEEIRQRKRNGEQAYDLKEECKKRDAARLPWIIYKQRRQMAGLLEQEVKKMGHMIGAEEATTRGAPAPRLRDLEAKPLDINALLAERKKKLKGMNVDQLEKAQEQKNKQQLKDMQSGGSPMPPPNPFGGGGGGFSMDLKKELLKKQNEVAKKQAARLKEEEERANGVGQDTNGIVKASPHLSKTAGDDKAKKADQTSSKPRRRRIVMEDENGGVDDEKKEEVKTKVADKEPPKAKDSDSSKKEEDSDKNKETKDSKKVETKVEDKVEVPKDDFRSRRNKKFEEDKEEPKLGLRDRKKLDEKKNDERTSKVSTNRFEDKKEEKVERVAKTVGEKKEIGGIAARKNRFTKEEDKDETAAKTATEKKEIGGLAARRNRFTADKTEDSKDEKPGRLSKLTPEKKEDSGLASRKSRFATDDKKSDISAKDPKSSDNKDESKISSRSSRFGTSKKEEEKQENDRSSKRSEVEVSKKTEKVDTEESDTPLKIKPLPPRDTGMPARRRRRFGSDEEDNDIFADKKKENKPSASEPATKNDEVKPTRDTKKEEDSSSSIRSRLNNRSKPDVDDEPVSGRRRRRFGDDDDTDTKKDSLSKDNDKNSSITKDTSKKVNDETSRSSRSSRAVDDSKSEETSSFRRRRRFGDDEDDEKPKSINKPDKQNGHVEEVRSSRIRHRENDDKALDDDSKSSASSRLRNRRIEDDADDTKSSVGSRIRSRRNENETNDDTKSSAVSRLRNRRNEDETPSTTSSRLKTSAADDDKPTRSRLSDSKRDDSSTKEESKSSGVNVIDIFADRNDDDAPKLSLRERRAARLGR